MDNFEVVPLVGVGPIELGMSRQAVHEAMGAPVYSFAKVEPDKPLTDVYFDGMFQLFFDAEDRVEYIELSAPINAVYKGIAVFETLADEMVAVVSADTPYDATNPELGYSYIFPELDMSLWRPTMPEPDQDPDDIDGRYFSTIGVGKRGYYRASNANQ